MIIQITSIDREKDCFVLRDAEDSVVLVIAENGNKSRRGHQAPLTVEECTSAIEGCDRCAADGYGLRAILEQRYPHRATTKANRETQHESRNRMCKGGAV